MMLGTLICIVLIAILLFFFVKTYNKFQELKSLRKSSFESLDLALNKRYDVMEELINYSGDFLEDENSAIITLLQAKLVPLKDRFEIEKKLFVELKKIMAIISEIPEINNTKELTNIRLKLAKVEKNINEVIVTLNDLTREYNDSIKSIPQNIVAILCGFKELKTYTVEYITR